MNLVGKLARLPKEALEELYWRLERRRCQTDLLYLCREYLGYKDLSDKLHGPIAERLKKWKDLLVLLPRGHLKSSLITIGKSIQYVLNNQNVRIKIVNASYAQAVEFITVIKHHLRNERLVQLFPEVLYANPDGESDLWREDRINVKRTAVIAGPTLEALGIDTGNIGKHCEIIIFDDIHDIKNTRTVELMNRVKEGVRLFLSVLEPTGLRLYVGTRWKREDQYGDLIKAKLDTIRCEDVDPETKEIAFPEKFTETILDNIRRELGSHFYFLQYKNRVLSDDDILFKEEWFKWFAKTDKAWTKMYILVDPAVSTADRACETVIQTIGQTEDNNYFVIKSDGFKAGVQEVVNKLFLEYLKYAKDFEVLVGIEKVAYQAALIQWVERDQNTYGVYFEVLPLEPRGRSKDFRIGRLAPLFERGQIWIHKDSCKKLYEQLSEYGGTLHVDHADTLGYLLDICQEEGSYEILREETEEDDMPWAIDSTGELSYLDY